MALFSYFWFYFKYFDYICSGTVFLESKPHSKFWVSISQTKNIQIKANKLKTTTKIAKTQIGANFYVHRPIHQKQTLTAILKSKSGQTGNARKSIYFQECHAYCWKDKP